MIGIEVHKTSQQRQAYEDWTELVGYIKMLYEHIWDFCISILGKKTLINDTENPIFIIP